MGKGNDLWDDSALINAFDNAMTTYKVMHSKTYEEDFSGEEKHTSDDNGKETTRHMEQVDNDNNVSNSATEMDMPCYNTDAVHEEFPIHENNLSADLHAPESHTQSSGFPRTDGIIGNCSDQQTVYYNQLLGQFYDLEEQKQKIFQQLHQANYWSYQNPVQCSTNQAYQVPGFDASKPDGQPACSLCSCHCLAASSIPACAIGDLSSGGYCCFPAWTACYSASQPHQYPGYQCPVGSGTCSLVTSCMVNPMKQSTPVDDNAVKIGMMAAERAISSTQKEISAFYSVREEKEKGKDTEEGSGICDDKGSLDINSETNLAVVLSAWYAAGFHTGRYLMEQSKRGTDQ